MSLLPPSLLTVLLLALTVAPALSSASPQPALVPDAYLHLIPHHTLFFRQLQDLQTFPAALGGVPASPITNSGDAKRPFQVDGDTFTDFKSAATRSCDNQFNACSQAANEGGNAGGLKVTECDVQKGECRTAQDSATAKDFQSAPAPPPVLSENIGADPQFPDFDLICEV